jgi:GT2 family glycosyltransferase
MTTPPSTRRAGLTVVVVAYGSADSLRRCLAPLADNYPILVADNSASPEVARICTEAGALYLDTGGNLGFARAVNAALAHLDLARDDVLLLNPDAEVSAASVEALRAALDRRPALACVAPLQRRVEGAPPATVCWPFDTPWGPWLDAVGLGGRRRQSFLSASVLLVRGAALADVGGFDEGYFLYAEEQDWQRRALGRGWAVAPCTDAEALHQGGGTDDDVIRREDRLHAGTERYVRKWYGAAGWQLYRVGAVAAASRRLLTGGRQGRLAARRQLRRYLTGPYRGALRSGSVPALAHRVPDLVRRPAPAARASR